MTTDKIHVLPVGFDINRLFAPLASREFDVDRVILLQSAGDILEEEEGEQSATDKLVADALETVQNRIENDLDIPVERQSIPPFNQYRQLYARAYGLLRELSNHSIVYVNVSSLPLSAASAFINAEAALTAEAATIEDEMTSPHDETEFDDEFANRSDRLYTYYIRPEQYLEAEIVELIREQSPELLEPLVNHASNYPEVRLLYSLAQPVRSGAETVLELVKEAEQQLQTCPVDQRGDDWESKIDRCSRLAAELTDVGPSEPVEGQVRREEYAESPAFPDVTVSLNVEQFSTEFKTAFERADNGAFSDELRSDVRSHIDELQSNLELYSDVLDWSDEFIIQSGNVSWFLHLTEDLIETVDDYGMTKGMESIDDGRHLAVPMPAVYELRAMEVVILKGLASTDRPQSIGGLSETVASLLRESLSECIHESEPESMPEFAEQARELIDNGHLSLDELEADLQTDLRSRIQYNLGSLAEKQYISQRRDPDDKRRRVTELTTTGECWMETHDLHNRNQDSFESILEDRIEKYYEEYR